MPSMLRTSALWVSAILTTGFGLAMLFAPEALSELYGTASSDATVQLSRIFGGVTLGLSVLALTALRVESVDGRRAIDSTFLAGYSMITITSIWNTLVFGTGGADLVIWSTTGVYVILAAAFAYFLLREDTGAAVRRGRPVA